MTEKPKLEPGQRVRVYESTGLFDAEVVKIHTDRRPEIIVRFTDGTRGFDRAVFSQQCRKLRPKQKPEKERERKTWLVGSFSQTEDGGTTGVLFPNGHVRPPCFGTDLVTIEPGQVVLGREELARAWDSSPLNTPHHISIEFLQVCEALGLGKDKA